jgi:hypothetical protein
MLHQVNALLLLFALAVKPLAAQTQAASQLAKLPPGVLVRFERTACFGFCPVDVLTVFRNGRMCYLGQANAPRTGTYTSRLSRVERKALQQAFAEARFFDLAPAYTSNATDLPTYYLTYVDAGRQHQVEDYDQAPPQLKALETRLAQLIEAPRAWRRTQPAP